MMQCPKILETELDPVELESDDEDESIEKLSKLFKKSKLTDITIVVGKEELHFSKYLLMEASTILTERLEQSEDQSQLKLEDVEYDEVVFFLACLHPTKLLSVSDTILESVVEIAYEFKHVGVLKKCEEYIVRQFELRRETKDGMYPNFFFHLRVADRYGLSKALKAGLSSKTVKMAYYSHKSLGQNTKLEGYKDNEDFEDLSLETQMEVFRIRLEKAEAMIDPNNPY